MWKPKDHQDDDRFVGRVRLIAWYAVIVIALTLIGTFLLYRTEEVGKYLRALTTPIRPVIFGLVIAYLLAPVDSQFQEWFSWLFRKSKHQKSLSRVFSIFFAELAGVGAVVALVWLIIPGLVDSIAKLAASLPDYVREIQTWITGLQHGSPELKSTINTVVERLSDAFENWMKNDFTKDITNLMSQVTTGVVDVVRFVFNFLVGVVISVYVLRDRELVKWQATKLGQALFSEKTVDKIADTLKTGDKIFGGFIHGKILDSLVIGLICFVVLSIMQMPYTLLVSVLVGVTNLAPTFGPFVGGIVGALILFLVNPWYALWFLLFTLILQTIDGYILKPKLFGDSLGVPAVWILVSIIFFGRLFGILGVIISIPLAAIVNYIYQTRIVNRLRKRRENNELQRSILKAKESERDKSMKA